jgi:hypothetical protein
MPGNDRKKHFSPRQIAVAYGTLLEKGWIIVQPAE